MDDPVQEIITYRSFDARANTQYSDFASDALDGDFWVVTRPFHYYVGEKGSKRTVEVPAGFLTDGASVPRIFWNIIPPWGRYGQCAILHDYLCEYLQVLVEGKPSAITRAECDRILLESMTVLEVPTIKRNVIYAGVSSYRIAANVRKPSFSADKFSVEESLRKRFAKDGIWS